MDGGEGGDGDGLVISVRMTVNRVLSDIHSDRWKGRQLIGMWYGMNGVMWCDVMWYDMIWDVNWLSDWEVEGELVS